MANSIVILDKVQATKSGNIESARYYVSSTPTAINNGRLVELAGLISGQKEIQKATICTDLKNEVLLVASVEMIYDESVHKGLDDFTNAAGANIRAYHLVAGDIFTVSDDAITGDATAVGNYIIASTSAATFVNNTTTLPAVTVNRFVGKVIEKGTLGSRGIATTTIQVVRA